MRERPTWEPIWLKCRKCGHPWDDWQPSGVPIETFVAHLGTYHCPQCGAGADHIVIRSKPLAEVAS